MSGWVREPRLGQLSGGLLVGKIGAAERRRLAIAGERVPVLRFWAPLRTGRDSGCHPPPLPAAPWGLYARLV